MAEPTTSGTAGIGLGTSLVVILGPAAGPGATILFAALSGALWALVKEKDLTKSQGAFLILRLVLTSLALTGAIALWVEAHYKIPALSLLSPLAFGIAAIGERWRTIFGALARRVEILASGKKPTDE